MQKNRKEFNKMNYVFGIHMGHDASISILENGKPIFCLSEERLVREKMYYGFPSRSLDYALTSLNIEPENVSLLSLDTEELCELIGPEEMSRRFKTGISRNIATQAIKSKKVLSYFFGVKQAKTRVERKAEAQNILLKELSSYGFKLESIKVYDHHLSHAASAFWPSPFKQALFATCDGRGDKLSGLLGVATGSQLNVKHQINEISSVGQFYAAVTFCLGFKPNRHEGKITGLAAHGDVNCLGPRFMENIYWNPNGSYEIRLPEKYRLTSENDLNQYLKKAPLSFKDRIVLHSETGLNTLMYSTNWYSLLSYLEDICRGESRENVAAGVQYFAEEVCTQFISRNLPEHPIPVVLAGGVYSNVRINQKVREISGVSNVYIQPAMGDDGLSLGAALLGYAETDLDAKHALQLSERPTQVNNIYLGPDYSNEIERSCEIEKVNPMHILNIEKKIAEWIHAGKIVAYYRGKMEFGPRALGHRSILASATDKNINTDLNHRLHRTEFMPFAPSILAEHAHEYLLDYKPEHVASEYMTITYNIASKFKDQIPAVVHVDGTARPQVVHSQNEPHYHRIIHEYYKLSGIPLIINTSYNIHEEPIVCTPQDAIRTYKAGSVDILVMENFAVGADL
jgi:carbamoyltransferase